MFTLTRAKTSRGKAGEPLPTVFQSLADKGTHIRRGQFTLIAAAPGVGKSLFALINALRCNVRTFYFSADSDAFTMYLRSGAHVTGWTVQDVENMVSTGNTRELDARLGSLDHIRFAFEAAPTLDDIEDELTAYAMSYGDWPELIVVDNLSNVWQETEGYQALEETCDFLHELARKTGAAVVALHHVTGEFDAGKTPVPQSGLRGKVSKVPEMILTLFHDGDEVYGEKRMGIAIVKNRNGKADPSGGFTVALRYKPDTMTLEDIPTMEGADPGYGGF